MPDRTPRLSRLQEQIESRRIQQGLSMRELSLNAGLNETAVKAIMQGRSESPRGKTLQAIAHALGTTVQALIGQSPEADVPSQPRATAIMIPELDVRAMAGAGAEDEEFDGDGQHAVVSMWSLPSDYLRSFTPSPLAVRIIRVVGDSMEPHYPAGDRVLVDTAHRIPSPPGVYVVWDGYGLVLKHIEVLTGRKPPVVRLSSDNAAYAPYECAVTDLRIQGRVMGKWVWK
jgi:phage repressor protein C with HTH and peptisase S24 domain